MPKVFTPFIDAGKPLVFLTLSMMVSVSSGPQGAKVDDLDFDAFACQDFRSLERAMHHDRGGDDRNIAAFAPDRGLADRHAIGFLRHLALHLVEKLVLENHDRIGIIDGRKQQALGIMRALMAEQP